MVKDRHKTARLEDIARQAGVSVSTVSRALNGGATVNSETRQRIMELARSEHYSGPTRRPRLVRNGNANAITVVLSPIQPQTTSLIDPFLLSILGGITIALQQHGLDLSISHDVLRDERGLARFAQDNVRDGIIFLGQSPYHDGLNRLMQTGRKFVVWGAREVDQAYCTVGSDNWKGGERATSHLLRLGRKRVAFLGYVGTTELQQRQQGYLAALDKAGIAADPGLQRVCSLTPDRAMEVVDSMLDQGIAFDALVCVSDLVALGAMRALMRRGLSVPDDVAIVGYDDIELAAHMHPALTTIRQDTVKAGRLLVAKLLSMLEGGQATSEVLPTDLVVRETCGA